MTAAAPHQRVFTILGCSSSTGVPRANGDWGTCDPENPRNRRRRASLLVEQIAPDGAKTTVVIDTGPDFREQMIAAGVKNIDAVLYSHAHADHLHGINDLRDFYILKRRLIPAHADAETMARIRESFGYCLETPAGSSYPPILEPVLIETLDRPFSIAGEGGSIPFQPLLQRHGDIHSLGFRIGDFAYCSDVSQFTEQSLALLQGLDILVIDALQYKHHSSHFSLEEALEWIEKLRPRHAVLTHMHIYLDYDRVSRETPAHVEPAYDGLSLTVNVMSLDTSG